MTEINENPNNEFDEWFNEEQSEHEWNERKRDIIRAKWSFDGATTLTEAATMLRNYADFLDKLYKEGWQLEGLIVDDYGYILHPDLVNSKS